MHPRGCMRVGGRGYEPPMTLSTAPLEDGHEVRTVAELDEVLRAQHVELRALLCKLPLLHHGAREDVFLLVRRRLAREAA